MKKNKQIFDGKAKGWENPMRVKMAGKIAGAMIKSIKPTSNMLAADIGAGTGLISFKIAEHVKKVYSIDSSAGMLSVIKRKMKLSGLGNLKTIFCDIEKSQPKIPVLDIIVSSMAMHHVKDTGHFADLLYSMLRHGGTIAIADLDKEDGGFHKDGIKAGARHSGFDRKELKGIFAKAGFKRIYFKTVFSVVRENARKYPIFLMNAKKP